jgi:short-subunit dehydrogenase
MKIQRTWFITGVSSGFGKEVALMALNKGDQVIATFRKEDQLNSFLTENPKNAYAYLLDVSNFDQVTSVANEVISQFERIDVVVNSAGYGFVGVVEETSIQDAHDVMNINFYGTLAVTKAFLSFMRKQGSGHIIQISSSAGFVGVPSVGIYAASKFAVEGFTEALAPEMKPFGVNVTIVEPGAFRTEFMKGIGAAANPVIEYTASVANMRSLFESTHGNQDGDPAKGAAAILEIVESENPPLRLVLGQDSFDIIQQKLVQVKEELDQWSHLSLSTKID